MLINVNCFLQQLLQNSEIVGEVNPTPFPISEMPWATYRWPNTKNSTGGIKPLQQAVAGTKISLPATGQPSLHTVPVARVAPQKHIVKKMLVVTQLPPPQILSTLPNLLVDHQLASWFIGLPNVAHKL